METEYLIIGFVVCLLIATLWKAFRVLIKGLIGILDTLLSLFIPIGKCSCGEKIISVNSCNEGYVLICQNYDCRKQTNRYKSLIKAKTEWAEIRGIKC